MSMSLNPRKIAIQHLNLVFLQIGPNMGNISLLLQQGSVLSLMFYLPFNSCGGDIFGVIFQVCFLTSSPEAVTTLDWSFTANVTAASGSITGYPPRRTSAMQRVRATRQKFVGALHTSLFTSFSTRTATSKVCIFSCMSSCLSR